MSSNKYEIFLQYQIQYWRKHGTHDIYNRHVYGLTAEEFLALYSELEVMLINDRNYHHAYCLR